MKDSQKSVSERIRFLISLKDMTIQEFSDYLSFPKGTLEKYLNSPRLPSAEFLSSLHAKMRVSAHWLLDGYEPMYLVDPSKLDETRGEQMRNSPSGVSKFVPILRYDVGASAGTGSLVEAEVGTGNYAFNRSWLKRRGLNPDDLAVISVRGDSMEPELNDNDLILLDRSLTTPKDGEMFVVRYAGDLFVKRVQVMPFGGYTLSSTNKFYSRIVVETNEAIDLKFIGKVVASMHEW